MLVQVKAKSAITALFHASAHGIDENDARVVRKHPTFDEVTLEVPEQYREHVMRWFGEDNGREAPFPSGSCLLISYASFDMRG